MRGLASFFFLHAQAKLGMKIFHYLGTFYIGKSYMFKVAVIMKGTAGISKPNWEAGNEASSFR